MIRLIALLAFSFFLSASAQATDFYSNPLTGSLNNNGLTPQTAWPGLEEINNAGFLTSIVQGGDTIHLATGLHGDVRLGDKAWSPAVTFKALPQNFPVLDRLKGNTVQGLTLDGLYVTHSLYNMWGDQSRGLINIWYGSSNITIRNCKVFSVYDSNHWGYNEWDTLSSNGIAVLGSSNILIEDNHVWNVYNGILFGSGNATVRGNRVDNFVADALRAAGDDILIEGNIITDNYSVGGVHSDSLQFYAPGNVTFHRVTIRDNISINVFDQGRPFIGHLQGYAAFDNPAVDWVVENNYLISNTIHGISITSGSTNGRFVNNTVFGIYGDQNQYRTSIYLPGSGNVVRNNLACDFSVNPSQNTVDHNLLVTPENMWQVFVDPGNLGFRLKADSPARDAGSNNQAPARDFEGDARPHNGIVDIGADELDS